MKTALAAVCVALCSLVWTAPSVAGEKEERFTIQQDAKEAFLAGRFDKLDATANAYRTTRDKTESGQAKLGFFYEMLGSANYLYGAADAPALDRMDAQIAAWLKAAPRSKSANILRARVLLARAWLARGEGFANTVTPEQWAEAYKFAGEAGRQLDESRALAADDPEWHTVSLKVAQIASWPDDAFKAVADEGLKVDPTYFPLHAAILHDTLPQWGGGWNVFDDAVDDMVARTAGELGQTLYARSYQWLASIQLRRSLFEKSLAKWPRMKQGFEDLTARYPSDWNFNTFGVYACFANDWDTLRTILDRLGDRVMDELWYTTSVRERCVRALEQVRIEAEDAAFYSKPRPIAEEMAERFRIEQEATAALLEGRFDEIEAERAHLLASKDRTGGGYWKLAFYTEGLTPSRLLLPGSEEAAKKVRAQIAAWRESRPDSIAAALAAIRLDVYDGRLVRGLNYKKTDVGGGRSQEAKFAAAARRGLEASKASGERDPVWWSLLMLVDTDDLVTDETFVQDAFAALAVEPTYDETLDTVLARASFGPQFGETHSKMLALVLQASPQDRADEVYAASFLRVGDRWAGDQIVQNLNVDWPRMRRGLDAIVARWPTDWNLTAYACFACMAKDKPTAAALMARLGDRLVLNRWSDWRGQNECRSWAQAAQ